jgi:hypothetical protein
MIAPHIPVPLVCSDDPTAFSVDGRNASADTWVCSAFMAAQRVPLLQAARGDQGRVVIGLGRSIRLLASSRGGTASWTGDR